MTNKTKKAEKATANALLDLNLSDIIYNYNGITAFEAPKEEDTLNVDNNVNALSINIVVAFWWVVNYIVESFVRNICNYLKEDLKNYEISKEQQKHTAELYKNTLIDGKLDKPIAFEQIEMTGNMIEVAVS